MRLFRSLFLKRLSSAHFYVRQCHNQNVTHNIRKESQQSDMPVQFFGSGAASWRAKDTRSGGADEMLWYQPYVVIGSVAIFLLYFCVLREESDIDRKLEGSLFEQVSGLEEVQLIVNYKYNKQNNMDTTVIEKRLSELGVDVKELEREIQAKH